MEDFNDGMDGKIACRMRKVNSEQFHTLVKMHLSFELDLNTEENDMITEKAKLKKWGILHFSKKSKSTPTVQKEPEGAALTKEGINQVRQLVEYLSKDECIIQEGIFRRTGKLTRQQELKNALYQGLPLDLDEGRFSIHDYASVLKGFLADLPEPLLTDLHYPAHCQIAELSTSSNNGNDSRLLRSLQLLLLLLPPPNRIVLKKILGLLNKTAAHENSNKMNCDTLATLFTPHLLCPRKLSPEALHVNSQNLSGLVAFMIKKGNELFDIPPKLSTDIRAFWMEQEKKLLSPQKVDPNESTTDATDTAHTVFSFVDRNLTAKATAAQDTQAALAQLYAHIQSMPESAKKRRLVKQFNKENGQGTPRHVKNSAASKSFGDSIKKRIFQKKLLNQKKIIDVKLGCNFNRSSSEENILTSSLESSLKIPKLLSKSEDELNDLENCEQRKQEGLLKAKQMSSSTGNLEATAMKKKLKKVGAHGPQEERSKVILRSFARIGDSPSGPGTMVQDEPAEASTRFPRHRSEPPDMYSCQPSHDAELVRQISDPVIPSFRPPSRIGRTEPDLPTACPRTSPAPKVRLGILHAAHTSTPSNLLRKSLAISSEYVLTPITDDDQSMSPITQSTTKMTKAMQETMMTPRSRKPVIMVSASNLCGLATLNNGSMQYNSTNSLQTPSYDLIDRKNCASILEESPTLSSDFNASSNIGEDKENLKKIEGMPLEQSSPKSLDDINAITVKKIATTSATNPLKEYYLSRSVLTASPVDLSFTSRTGDFEQSESDLNILPEDANNPSSDTSGIASGSTNSMNNSAEKIDEAVTSPRKRCTSLQRNDSKRSIKDELICDTLKMNKILKQKQLNESTLNSINVKDSLPETSF